MERKKYISPTAAVFMLAMDDVIRTSGDTELKDGHNVNDFNLGWLNFGG